MAEEHSYKVGVSTGFFYFNKDPALLGLATKIGGLGATTGVQFVQVDLESIAEFREPDVVNQVRKMMSKLGITDVGLHGEIGEKMSVDCAEKRIWDQTHDRLVQTVRFASDLGFRYVNVHFSARPILSYTESQMRTQGYFYPVVAPDGRTLQNYVKDSKGALAEVPRHLKRGILLESKTGKEERHRLLNEAMKDLNRRVDTEYRKFLAANPDYQGDKSIIKQNIAQQERDAIYQEVRERIDSSEFQAYVWLKMGPQEYESYQLDDGEIGAFSIIAAYMKERGDYLWSTIAQGKNPDELFFENEQAYCAAVTSKYIEGHLNVDGRHNDYNKKYLGGMSIKQWCESKKLYMLFENPEANQGQEGAYRLFHPQHYYHTIRNINSQYVRICLDVEHMVSHALDPDIEIPKLPDDFGKYMVLWHLGQATPYGGTAHIPIPRGSIAQEQIYRWIYWIKKKGFKEGYLLFERGGGRTGRGNQNYEVFEDSVQAIKQIAHYLEKDIAPNNLPPEFFGVSASNKEVWARQVTTMREHAWDPLEGLLSVPEEKHTFFGRNAVDKGKAQEWEKRKFR